MKGCRFDWRLVRKRRWSHTPKEMIVCGRFHPHPSPPPQGEGIFLRLNLPPQYRPEGVDERIYLVLAEDGGDCAYQVGRH